MRETAEWYRSFAEGETAGHSAVYTEWAASIAGDIAMLALIDELPEQKRQPNLLFACARFLGAPEGGYGPFRDWLVINWLDVAAETAVRMTQTNEPGRCASLMPALALLDGPLALLEVGASAGLCLYPDSYSYSYDGIRLDPADGPSTVLLESKTNGRVPLPAVLPEIVWRAGIDLDPLDLRHDDDMRWLRTLIWPEQQQRRDRLDAAIAIAREDPPLLVRGDAQEALAGLARQAPDDATLVIIASGVLVYLPAARRRLFVDEVRSLGADWISLEGRASIPSIEAALPEGDGRFVLALNERPLAWTGPHGQSLDWF